MDQYDIFDKEQLATLQRIYIVKLYQVYNTLQM